MSAFNPVVLVNTWNQGAWLATCLDSLLGQSVPPAEVVVHDDGSEDETEAVLQRFSGQIRVVRSDRSEKLPGRVRQARAVELALRQSSGDPVFLVDGDDGFLPHRIESYLRIFEADPQVLMVQSPLLAVDDQGRPLPAFSEPFRHVQSPLKLILSTHDPDRFQPTSALAFRRAFLERSLPLDDRHGTELWLDTVLSLKAVFECGIASLLEPSGFRRQHPLSDSALRQLRRTHRVRQTWAQTQVFNHFADLNGSPAISPWRNVRFYRQLLRLMLPDRLRQRLVGRL